MWGCEAETSHLLCRRREEEQPSVPESVFLTFTFSSRRKKKGSLDNRPKIIQSGITAILCLIQCTVYTPSVCVPHRGGKR